MMKYSKSAATGATTLRVPLTLQDVGWDQGYWFPPTFGTDYLFSCYFLPETDYGNIVKHV